MVFYFTKRELIIEKVQKIKINKLGVDNKLLKKMPGTDVLQETSIFYIQ